MTPEGDTGHRPGKHIDKKQAFFLQIEDKLRCLKIHR